VSSEEILRGTLGVGVRPTGTGTVFSKLTWDE
jgi:hypothetical protein